MYCKVKWCTILNSFTVLYTSWHCIYIQQYMCKYKTIIMALYTNFIVQQNYDEQHLNITFVLLSHIANFMKHFRMKRLPFLPLLVWWTAFNGNSICALSDSLSSESAPESLELSMLYPTLLVLLITSSSFTITFYHWLWQGLYIRYEFYKLSSGFFLTV